MILQNRFPFVVFCIYAFVESDILFSFFFVRTFEPKYTDEVEEKKNRRILFPFFLVTKKESHAKGNYLLIEKQTNTIDLFN